MAKIVSITSLDGKALDIAASSIIKISDKTSYRKIYYNDGKSRDYIADVSETIAAIKAEDSSLVQVTEDGEATLIYFNRIIKASALNNGGSRIYYDTGSSFKSFLDVSEDISTIETAIDAAGGGTIPSDLVADTYTINSGGSFIVDAGNTYVDGNSGLLRFYAGGSLPVLLSSTQINLNEDVLLQPTKKLLLDSDKNTYISSSIDDEVQIYVGGSSKLQISDTAITTFVDFNLGSNLRLLGDIELLNLSGVKIGTAATEKLAFYGATPVVQPTTITQTYSTSSSNHEARTASTLTDNGGGVAADGTIDAINDIALSTADTYTDAAVNTAVNALVTDTKDAVKELSDQINKLIVDQVNTAQVLNDLIDKLQTIGLIA